MSRNRLAEATSPYLLQHKDNPVHWWTWGPDALEEARRSGKPILLSVGYAACHWCHVMAHESFEDGPTADVMNDLFVNIKVDREERPDIDAIYMGALHRLGEQGGWPLTMFLDAEARPFFGGTYFPKTSRYGRPAFVDILRQVSRIYHEEPDKVRHNAEMLTAMLAERTASTDGVIVSDGLLQDLTRRMVNVVDREHGGINGAPKFPQWSFFWLLWRGALRYQNDEAKRAVLLTLSRICQGGIYDHLGGGFARYSVDERWLAPHFEKMLYDNALLIDLLTEAWRETHDPLYRTRIEETAAWLAREMIADGGGFAASLDADSEGEEGKFYVWSKAEIIDVLGPEDAAYFSRIYDVSEVGNWEGHNILNRLDTPQMLDAGEEEHLARLRARLLDHRARRIRPGWDDKVLADWNGLMIAALSRASIVFERPDWLEMAATAFRFVATGMSQDDGRLCHSIRLGQPGAAAVSSDYANMIWAAIRLYEATAEKAYLDQALAWNDVLHRRYWLSAEGRYAATAEDAADVLVRLASGTDEATPNANAIQVSNLAHLTLLTGDPRHVDQAIAILESFSADIGRNLIAHSGLIASALDVLSPQQIVITGGSGAETLQRALASVAVPGAIEQRLPETGADLPPALAGKSLATGEPAMAFLCVGPQCSAPISSPEVLLATIKEQRAAIG